MANLTRQIESIMANNPGKIFSINDFYDLGTKNTIKSILRRLSAEGRIARVIDGLYAKPKYSEVLKEHSYPDVNSVAEKIADKFSWRIVPTGDAALNYAGLSTQVPNENIFVSDGEYREYVYRGKKIIFKHATNRTITPYSRKLSILIQAIKALGKDNIDEEAINRLSIFSKDIQNELDGDIGRLPFWIQEALSKIKEN